MKLAQLQDWRALQLGNPVRLLAIVLLLGAISIAHGASTPAAMAPVSIANYAYSPKVIFIKAGDTVVWTTTVSGEEPHTVTADDLSFDSGDLPVGQPYSHPYNTVGEFPYYCKNHSLPGGAMSGTVVVLGDKVTYLSLIVK